MVSDCILNIELGVDLERASRSLQSLMVDTLIPQADENLEETIQIG